MSEIGKNSKVEKKKCEVFWRGRSEMNDLTFAEFAEVNKKTGIDWDIERWKKYHHSQSARLVQSSCPIVQSIKATEKRIKESLKWYASTSVHFIDQLRLWYGEREKTFSGEKNPTNNLINTLE